MSVVCGSPARPDRHLRPWPARSCNRSRGDRPAPALRWLRCCRGRQSVACRRCSRSWPLRRVPRRLGTSWTGGRSARRLIRSFGRGRSSVQGAVRTLRTAIHQGRAGGVPNPSSKRHRPGTLGLRDRAGAASSFFRTARMAAPDSGGRRVAVPTGHRWFRRALAARAHGGTVPGPLTPGPERYAAGVAGAVAVVGAGVAVGTGAGVACGVVVALGLGAGVAVG